MRELHGGLYGCLYFLFILFSIVEMSTVNMDHFAIREKKKKKKIQDETVGKNIF